MKGSPEMPMCGFSNFAVELLKFYSKKNSDDFKR
jgi:glutaredoxin-related protein